LSGAKILFFKQRDFRKKTRELPVNKRLSAYQEFLVRDSAPLRDLYDHSLIQKTGRPGEEPGIYRKFIRFADTVHGLRTPCRQQEIVRMGMVVFAVMIAVVSVPGALLTARRRLFQKRVQQSRETVEEFGCTED
jgi:hypothetical protein